MMSSCSLLLVTSQPQASLGLCPAGGRGHRRPLPSLSSGRRSAGRVVCSSKGKEHEKTETISGVVFKPFQE